MHDDLFQAISTLVMHHSPSGVEAEIDHYLLAQFRARGLECWLDAAGNAIAKIPGRGQGAIAITAHKDEIGGIVKTVGSSGRVDVRKLGGSYPWVYGEGVVDLLGDRQLHSHSQNLLRNRRTCLTVAAISGSTAYFHRLLRRFWNEAIGGIKPHWRYNIAEKRHLFLKVDRFDLSQQVSCG